MNGETLKFPICLLSALIAAMLIVSSAAFGQPKCAAHDLTDQQVKEIIDENRTNRSDLADPFPEYTWSVRRQGCHYLYMETGVPSAIHFEQIIKLNQFGDIVDAYTGDGEQAMSCPEEELTERELSDIVEKARANRDDLPPPYPDYSTRADRLRCLYLYFEYAVPRVRGKYHVFTVDPFGELLDYHDSKPY